MNKATTLNHYWRKLHTKEKQFNHKMFLPMYFEEMIGDKKEVNIAELGSAMFCTIGNLWNDCKVNMYASDIKADDFNRMLREANVVPVIKVTKEDMENLSYPDAFFDIVHCVNALDHTGNPSQALYEMKRVTKPGGWIYLRHFPEVGELEGYTGEHQWNIKAVGNDVEIWNKQGVRIALSSIFDNIEVKRGREWSYEPKDLIIVRIRI